MTRCVRVIGVIVLLALLGPAGARAAGPLTWSAPRNVEFASRGTPTAVACAAGDLCVVGDDAGYVLSTTEPTGGAQAWAGAAIDVHAGTHHAITGLACPSTTLCVAVDDAGGVLTTSDPTGPASAWARAKVDTSSAFTAVSCASVTDCVAVDKAGDAWSSATPAGGAAAWSSANIDDGGSLTAVSCPTDAFCAAADHAGNVLIDAAQSPTWTVTNLTSHVLNAVSCASATLCVAGGVKTGAISSSAPTSGAPAWHTLGITGNRGGPDTVSSVGCSAPSTCLAGVQDGGYYETDDPIGGSWTAAGGDDNSFEPIAIGCDPQGACLGADEDGEVGGLTARGLFVGPIEGGAPDLAGVSCPQADRCYVDDDEGQILTSTVPTGDSTAWAISSGIPDAEDGNVPYDLACPSAALCLTGIGDEQRGDAGTTGPELAGISTNPEAPGSWHLFRPSRHHGFYGISRARPRPCASSSTTRGSSTPPVTPPGRTAGVRSARSAAMRTCTARGRAGAWVRTRRARRGRSARSSAVGRGRSRRRPTRHANAADGRRRPSTPGTGSPASRAQRHTSAMRSTSSAPYSCRSTRRLPRAGQSPTGPRLR